MDELNREKDNCRIKAFVLGMVFGISLFIIFSGHKIVYIH